MFVQMEEAAVHLHRSILKGPYAAIPWKKGIVQMSMGFWVMALTKQNHHLIFDLHFSGIPTCLQVHIHVIYKKQDGHLL